jgi:hypothetical protein
MPTRQPDKPDTKPTPPAGRPGDRPDQGLPGDRPERPEATPPIAEPGRPERPEPTPQR